MQSVEYMTSLQVLLQDEIAEIDAVEKKNTKLHCNPEQNLINLLAIAGCLKLDCTPHQTRHSMGYKASNKFDHT